MAPYIVDWLNLFVRWLHFVAGVAWIGSSFYFIWLDDHLEPPADVDDDAKGVAGEVWSVHGGGFYHAQKYRGAPRKLPSRLHWFKWEAYTTWLSGIFLLALVYWYGAQIYLLPEGDGFSAPTAIVIAAAYIVGGWLIYDVLCKSPLARDTRVFALVLLLFGVSANCIAVAAPSFTLAPCWARSWLRTCFSSSSPARRKCLRRQSTARCPTRPLAFAASNARYTTLISRSQCCSS
jgi:uncharacterized membrane protein